MIMVRNIVQTVYRSVQSAITQC